MASDEEENPTISSVLDSIGLGQYLEEFLENRITVEQVEMMSESDFRDVGVYHIGTRLKIKQACRNATQCKQDSTLDVFRHLQGKRKYPAVKNVKRNYHLKNESATRRVYLGWKNMVSPQGAYKVVNVNCGGGRQLLDAQKNLTLRELEIQILDIYFPNGRSENQNMNVSDINYFIANFAGDPLPTMDDEGGFTVAKYLKKVKSFPVRLYLHTSIKKDSSSLEGSSNDNIVGTDTPALQIPPTNVVNLDRSPTEGSATSDDDFVDVVQTGTPTVLFNPRNRRPRRNLSLSHCSSSYSGTNLQNSPTTEREDAGPNGTP